MITSYNMRNSENELAIPLPLTNYYKNSLLSYSGAVLWNSLLSAVRQATFLTNFQRLLINSDTAFMKNKLYFSFIFQVSNIFRSEMLNLYK